MFGSALYYPHIDIDDGEWLRSAILFWDEIKTIVPTTITKPYTTRDTRICEQEGYLRRLPCDVHQDLLRALGKRIVSLIDEPDWLERLLKASPNRRDPSFQLLRQSTQFGRRLSRQFQGEGVALEDIPIKLRERLVTRGLTRIHGGKLSPEIRDLLRMEGLSQIHRDKMLGEVGNLLEGEPDGEWLLVDSRFADMYMAVLAAMLATKEDVSPLTAESIYQSVNLRELIDEAAGVGKADARGAIIALVMEGLRIDPKTPVQKLIAFRRSRADQLAELSAVFDDLKGKIENAETKKELREKAARVYQNNVRPGLEKLKAELGDQKIQSIWQGFHQPVTVAITGATLLGAFTSGAPGTLLGLGAFLTVANVSLNYVLGRRKARRASPYTYLLDATRKFSKPAYV